MDDEDQKKQLSQMMTESLSPENSVNNAPSSSGNLYQDYIKPYVEEKIRQNQQQFQQQQQNADQANSIMSDRIKMALNPSLQGPPVPSMGQLAPEAEDQKRFTQMALGTMSNTGGAAKGWLSNPKNIEALENLEKNTTEGLVGKLNKAAGETNAPTQYSQEGLQKAQDFIDHLIKTEQGSPELRQHMLQRLKTAKHQAGVKGIKVPE